MFSPSKLITQYRKAGSVDPKTGALWTTPWVARTEDGIYIGLNDEVWLYSVLPSVPFRWEDPQTQLAIGGPLHEVLMDIGATSRRPIGGLPMTGDFRDIHLVAIQWEERPVPPQGATDRHAAFLQETFTFLSGRKVCFLGVKLRKGGSKAAEGADSIVKYLLRMAKQAMKSGYPDLADYRRDRERMQAVMGRNGCRRPTLGEQHMLESWYNMGKGADALLVAEPSGRRLTCAAWPQGIEMGAVVEFERIMLNAPQDAWAADAFSHNDGAVVVSVRGELVPSDVARNKFRSAQRKVKAAWEEEQKTGDLERKEHGDTFSMGQAIENYFADGSEPLIGSASIIMAREATDSEDTYQDMLRSRYGIIAKTMEMRQIDALDETLPCSNRRHGNIRPTGQEISVPMVAYSGISSFSQMGDETGLFLGLTLPDYSPVWVDPEASATRDEPPGMAIVGEPGSGKTFAGLTLAYQAVLQGHTCIFINPKSGPQASLADFARNIDGQVISLRDLEGMGAGALDPFRYCSDANIAAEILTQHILSSLVELSERQRVELQAGIQEGARLGARCASDALKHVADHETLDLIEKMTRGSTLFALAMGRTAQGALGIGKRGQFTLIEFDRPLALPTSLGKMKDYDPAQREAVATMRLITRASYEIMLSNRGGVLLVDEAWQILGSSEGVAAITQMGREGRSQAILPILLTQKIDDVVREGVDLETFISRVLVLRTKDPKEAKTGLDLVGLAPTRDRLQWLARAGALKPTADSPGRPAMGFYRDMANKHCAILIGPVPEYLRLMMSTNKTDMEHRARLLRQQQPDPGQAEPAA